MIHDRPERTEKMREWRQRRKRSPGPPFLRISVISDAQFKIMLSNLIHKIFVEIAGDQDSIRFQAFCRLKDKESITWETILGKVLLNVIDNLSYTWINVRFWAAQRRLLFNSST
jgi:hypothetical protein